MDKKLTKEQKINIDKIKSAIMVAREVFEGAITGEMVFGSALPGALEMTPVEAKSRDLIGSTSLGGVFDRVIEMENPEEHHMNLIASARLAKELFGTSIPDTAMVFGIFDLVYSEYDGDDEEDEDDDA